MYEKQNALASEIIGRIQAGKENAILFKINNFYTVTTLNQNLPIVNCLLDVECEDGSRVSIFDMDGGCNIDDGYILIADQKGLPPTETRFVLYKGDIPIASSFDAVRYHFYVEAVRGNQNKSLHTFVYTLFTVGNDVTASYISDGDENIVKTEKNSARRIKEGLKNG